MQCAIHTDNESFNVKKNSKKKQLHANEHNLHALSAINNEQTLTVQT